MQLDNDPKHPSHSTKEWFKKNEADILERLFLTEMLWKDLKQAVHMRNHTNIPDLNVQD